jgi:Fe-Mn family superoxide dismutase
MNDIREIITLLEDKSKPGDIEIVKLAYSDGSLAPVMSSSTVKFHYGKLAHGYAERFNKGEGDKSFNYAGAVLHNLFFTQFRSPRTNNKPNGPIGNLINSKFKNWDNFKEQFKEQALKLQGSGWVYLSRSGEIKTINNHQTRTDILILVDMWEHAYNLDYGPNKRRYLDNIWRIFDWSMINARWGQGYKK